MPLGKQFAGMWTLTQQMQARASGVWTGIFVPAIVAAGELYSWGKNGEGQVGINSGTPNFSSPVQIGTTDWALVGSGQYHSFATKTDGSLWTWGRNQTNGELGLNDTIRRSSPTQVGSGYDWPTTGSLPDHKEGNTFVIKPNGTLWAWGYNTQASQLGLGDNQNRSSPTQVGALTNWAHVSGGVTAFTGAVKTDGSLWSWGDAVGGQLGNNTSTPGVNSPIQIGSDYNWSKVYKGQGSSVAIKTNGTIWAWGGNLYGGGSKGAVGDNTNTIASSPVQIGTDTNWASVAIFNYEPGALAIRTTGSLWVWGSGNSSGRFGLNVVGAANISSPTQVGALTNWSMVSGHNYQTGAIKTDGTLWAWGQGSSGAIGDDTVINRSSPVQIGSATTWNTIRVTDGHMMATKNVVVGVPGYFTYP